MEEAFYRRVDKEYRSGWHFTGGRYTGPDSRKKCSSGGEMESPGEKKGKDGKKSEILLEQGRIPI